MLPYAIEYGMSVKEFWEEDPDLFWAYRFSYINKKRQEQEEMNTHCWLQGAYFYEAFSVALSNAFSKKKIEYSNHPYDFSSEKPKTSQSKLEQQLKERAIQIKKMLGENNNGK